PPRPHASRPSGSSTTASSETFCGPLITIFAISVLLRRCRLLPAIQAMRRRGTGRRSTAQFAPPPASVQDWKCDKIREEVTERGTGASRADRQGAGGGR